jgi:hypothetical protein
MSVKTTLVTIAKDVEVEAGKLLAALSTVARVTPIAAAALGTILAAFAAVLEQVQAGATNPSELLSAQFDEQFWTNIKSAWADVKALAADLGIKLP